MTRSSSPSPSTTEHAAPPQPSATAARGGSVEADTELLVPTSDGEVLDPEVSIVVPALNEARTIGAFVAWCREGLAKAGARGEILIVDSSTDDTAALALAAGARVLRAPRRGLGRAYIDGLPYVRGTYVIMGDCDCTYDFRELTPFVDELRRGAEFVMGSRFAGTIEPGAMPPLHRYLGTPVTTWILNVIFSSRFSDIHCGMRGITRDALQRMGLRSQSWEYASEMVLKSVHMRLRTAEVPIHFLQDVEGRQSHHKRSGWWSPWVAAWINLRAMFVYGADFFLLKPGVALTTVGLSLTLPLSLGPITVGRVTFSLLSMLLGLTLTTLGLNSSYVGILAHVLHDHSGETTERWCARFPYTPTALVSAALFAAGLGLDVALARAYVKGGYALSPGATVVHLGVTGLLLMIVGFTTFTFMLVLHATRVAAWRRP